MRRAYKTAGRVCGFGASGVQIGALLNQFIRDWWNNLKADGGEVDSISDVNSYYNMARANGMLDSIQFGMLGAYNIRTDGVNKYITKAYSIDSTPNNATQTTEASQPNLNGFIAPNEKWAIGNENGQSKYLTHPTISFAADEAWSCSFVVNMYGAVEYYSLNGSNTATIRYDGFNWRIEFVNNSSASYSFILNNLRSQISKNSTITLIADGLGSLTLYINGLFIQTISAITSFTSIYLGDGRNSAFIGMIQSCFIRSQALTPTQVEADYNWFKSKGYLGYEGSGIAGVQIGSDVFASSNFNAVASSNGTAIAEATDNTDWATGASRWCYHNDDPSRGAIYQKLYNKAARDVIIANPPSGWHVATEAELTALALNGGNALKYGGTDYWNTTGGTNSTGFTALGGSSRNADGTFNAIKDHAGFWCADSDKVMKVYHDSDTAEVVAVTSVNEGFSIRLIKD